MTEGAPVPTYVKLAESWETQKASLGMIEDYTYDDVIVHPQASIVNSTSEIDLSTELVKGITLQIPIVSANMDTVTEASMAIFMARVGGIGIIHRAMSIEEQVQQVKMVKDATQYVVENPPIISPYDSVAKARYLMEETQRGYVLIMGEDNKLQGLASSRDVHRQAHGDWQITQVMTSRDALVVAPPGVTMGEAQELMYQHRVEKLPLIDSEGNIAGVITDRDLRDMARYPLATKDSNGRLRVGVAIGIEEGSVERAQAVMEAGADIIVVDVLHGDSEQVIKTVKAVASLGKRARIMAGNVAMPSSTKRLIDAGADGVKVGYGPGAVCTTRMVTGTGRPQFSAVVESAAAAYDKNSGEKKATINADGNIVKGGDITKALAGGADHVMIGSLLAGTDESPGDIIRDDQTGARYKIYRGMASAEAHEKLAKARGGKAKNRAPQGTTTQVPYVGSAEVIIANLIDGAKHGVANSGAANIKGMQDIVSFAKQSMVGYAEGTPHGKTRNK